MSIHHTALLKSYEYVPLSEINSDFLDILYSVEPFLRYNYLKSVGLPTDTTKDDLIGLILRERIDKKTLDIDRKDRDTIFEIMEYFRDDQEYLEKIAKLYNVTEGWLLKTDKIELLQKLIDIRLKNYMSSGKLMKEFYGYLNTLLKISLMNENIPIIKLLVRNGAPITPILQHNSDIAGGPYIDLETKMMLINSSPITAAIYNDDKEKIKEYYRNGLINEYDDIGQFALDVKKICWRGRYTNENSREIIHDLYMN